MPRREGWMFWGGRMDKAFCKVKCKAPCILSQSQSGEGVRVRPSQGISFWHSTPKECENSRFEPGLPGGYEEGLFVNAGEYNILNNLLV